MVKIIQVNSEDGRHYEIEESEGKPKLKYKSVTTIIKKFENKDALFAWKNKVGEEKALEISNASSSRGNKVHKLIENYLLYKQEPIVDPEDNNLIYFSKLLPVINKISPRYIEEYIYWKDENESIGFGGSVDIFGTINTSGFKLRDCNYELSEEINFVGDWKTWNNIKYPKSKTKDGDKYYPLISYYLQLSAYCAAINQRTNKEYKLNQCFIFGVTKTCKQPFIYYLDKDSVNFYWRKMKELVRAYYCNDYFDWKEFESEADRLGYLGQRVDIC